MERGIDKEGAASRSSSSRGLHRWLSVSPRATTRFLDPTAYLYTARMCATPGATHLATRSPTLIHIRLVDQSARQTVTVTCCNQVPCLKYAISHILRSFAVPCSTTPAYVREHVRAPSITSSAPDDDNHAKLPLAQGDSYRPNAPSPPNNRLRYLEHLRHWYDRQHDPQRACDSNTPSASYLASSGQGMV